MRGLILNQTRRLSGALPLCIVHKFIGLTYYRPNTILIDYLNSFFIRKNEEIDDKSMIKRLRKRIAELETEISLLKSGEVSFINSLLFFPNKYCCQLLYRAYNFFLIYLPTWQMPL